MATTPNNIQMFIHCGQCLESKPPTISPQEWSHNEIGWTEKGLQVFCIRHKMNVLNLDFLGQKVEAS